MSYVRIVPAGEKLNEHVRQFWKNNGPTVFNVLECHCVLELPTGKTYLYFKNPYITPFIKDNVYNHHFKKAYQ